jgi:hypothetical protein
MRLPILVGLIALSSKGQVLVAQQMCGGVNHYRWKEKVEAPGSNAKPETVTVNQILDDWARPALRKSPFCAEREPKEKKRYVVTGWLWRVKDSDDDGDYHLEITQSKNEFSTRCLIAEIPGKEWGTGYGKVRAALESIIDGPVGGTKDFPEPVHIRVTGVAFWDGWHAGTQKPNQHGRCNAPGIGVWEIHPVTRIGRAK